MRLPPPTIPLSFPLKKKDRPSKPTIEPTTNGGEGAEVNAVEFEDSESEDEEAKEGHSQSALESMSQRIMELAKI